MMRLLSLLLVASILSCGGGDSKDTSSDANNDLNLIVPGQLAISSPTEDRSNLGLTLIGKVFSLLYCKKKIDQAIIRLKSNELMRS